MRRALVLTVVALAIVACKTKPPPPQTKPDAAEPIAIVDASSEAAADAAAHVHVKPPVVPPPEGARDVEIDPPPGTKSPRPTKWADAVDIVVQGASACTAVMLREWVKVTCPGSASIALLGGNIDGVMIDVVETTANTDPAIGVERAARTLTGVAIFPLRRGDRRVLEFNLFEQGFSGYGSSTPDSQNVGQVLSELWLEGDKGPRLEID